jgi:hypothetical protein
VIREPGQRYAGIAQSNHSDRPATPHAGVTTLCAEYDTQRARFSWCDHVAELRVTVGKAYETMPLERVRAGSTRPRTNRDNRDSHPGQHWHQSVRQGDRGRLRGRAAVVPQPIPSEGRGGWRPPDRARRRRTLEPGRHAPTCELSPRHRGTGGPDGLPGRSVPPRHRRRARRPRRHRRAGRCGRPQRHHGAEPPPKRPPTASYGR